MGPITGTTGRVVAKHRRGTSTPSMSMNGVIHRAVRRDLDRFRRALDAFTDGDRKRAAVLHQACELRCLVAFLVAGRGEDQVLVLSIRSMAQDTGGRRAGRSPRSWDDPVPDAPKCGCWPV